MTLRVSGKNFDIGTALREHVQDKISASVTKYFDRSYEGHVTLAPDGAGYHCDCVLHLASGQSLLSQGRAHDPYVAFDQAAERIDKRLRRYKRRLKDRAPQSADAADALAYYVLEAPSEEDGDEEEHGFEPIVVAEHRRTVSALSVSDAVAELDMSGAPVVLFRHAASGRVNVVYRRTDGHIGWLDPQSADAGK